MTEEMVAAQPARRGSCSTTPPDGLADLAAAIGGGERP